MPRPIGSLVFQSALFVFLFISPAANAQEKLHFVTPNIDGGYTLTIIPGNATNTAPFKLRLLGPGMQETGGAYYPSMTIIANTPVGDFGYAWIDPEQERIYINMYWVDAPDSLIPSDVNGCYEIHPAENSAPASTEEQIKVTIDGEVVSPGEYVLGTGSTLGDVLELAVMNPAPWRAVKQRVTVHRQTDGEDRETHHDCLTPQSPGRSFLLQDGDSIHVPQVF